MPTGNRNTVRDAPLDPTLTDVLSLLKRSVQADVRTHIPARVITYNVDTQEASVSVESLTVIPNRNDPTDRNAETVLPPIRIDGVQVAWQRTAAGYVTFPLLPGDTGYLEIFDRSIDTWRKAGVAADPGLDHMHNLSDCVFVPGLWSKVNPIPATDQTASVFHGTLMKIGRAATLAAARTTDAVSPTALMTTWMTQVATAINILAPLSVTPPLPVTFGTITGGSVKAKIE